MDSVKARKEVLTNLPSRHARGCPQNIMRSAMMALSTCDLDPRERMKILATIKGVLPCFCPKLEV